MSEKNRCFSENIHVGPNKLPTSIKYAFKIYDISSELLTFPSYLGLACEFNSFGLFYIIDLVCQQIKKDMSL